MWPRTLRYERPGLDPTNVVGRRVGAWLIDTLIVAAIAAGSWYALTKQISGPCFGGGVEIGGDCRGFTEDSNRGLWGLIVLLTELAIFWIVPGLTGSSPGKAAVGIRIISRNGGKPGLGKALIRMIMWIVDGFPYVIPNLVGFIAASTDDQHRRVGDRVAGTLVVDKSAAEQPVPGAQQFGQYGAGPAVGGYQPPAHQPYQQQPQQQVAAGVGVGSTAPGWYDDPHRQARLRYWDGASWTSHTSN
jgi:uncharacterized RDD family membrane protein YckC